MLAIEDSPWGLEAAAGAGLVTLAVAHSYERGALVAADLVVQELVGLRLEALVDSLAEASRAEPREWCLPFAPLGMFSAPRTA